MKTRQAKPDELDTVVRLRRETTAWLALKGLDQWIHDWPDTNTMIAGFERDLRTGKTWFAVGDSDDGQVLGCITINECTETGLWAADEVASALFVHRLTLDRRFAGYGVGARLLDFAGEQAQAAGRAWIRLDAWTTNTELHRYYKRQGFRHVRTVQDYFSPSAACFERPAAYRGVSDG